jgi:hypothetical protein
MVNRQAWLRLYSLIQVMGWKQAFLDKTLTPLEVIKADQSADFFVNRSEM